MNVAVADIPERSDYLSVIGGEENRRLAGHMVTRPRSALQPGVGVAVTNLRSSG
jgi:hypothetical protein